MKVLVDSSVWIDFFRRKNSKNRLPALLKEDLVVVNQLIIAELVPALEVKKDKQTIALLRLLLCHDIIIDWNEIIETQTRFVKAFKYFVGIADLIIFQNAHKNDLMLYSLDKDIVRLCELNKHPIL